MTHCYLKLEVLEFCRSPGFFVGRPVCNFNDFPLRKCPLAFGKCAARTLVCLSRFNLECISKNLGSPKFSGLPSSLMKFAEHGLSAVVRHSHRHHYDDLNAGKVLEAQ